jgi:hypothetical protein
MVSKWIPRLKRLHLPMMNKRKRSLKAVTVSSGSNDSNGNGAEQKGNTQSQ